MRNENHLVKMKLLEIHFQKKNPEHAVISQHDIRPIEDSDSVHDECSTEKGDIINKTMLLGEDKYLKQSC